MKKLNFLFTVLFVFLMAQVSFGQITGSGHDFQSETWNPSGEICIVCHTPHGADASYTPLWNHEVTVQSFTPYTSPTFDGTAVDPTGTSRLCLSCHDGTVGLEAFGGITTNNNNPTALVGASGSLATEHPVAFDYTTTLATTDGGLFDPAITDPGTGGTITSDWLFSNSMECATCHDVHNKFNIPKLLRKSNAASALCLTCHDK